jgi:xanthine/uracil/vitamin C permease (AzgA family)
MVFFIPFIGLVFAAVLFVGGAIGLRVSLSRMFGKPLTEGELARARVILLCSSVSTLFGFLIAWSSATSIVSAIAG